MSSLVPVDWMCAYIVPSFKKKGDKFECTNYRGISLLSVVLINRIRDITVNAIMDVQGGG